MLPAAFTESLAEERTHRAGSVLLRRGTAPSAVLYLQTGRATLGIMEGPELVHQLGTVQGPFWLDATSAVLGLPGVVDVVADSDVQVRRIPLGKFRQTVSDLNEVARTVLYDLARAHRRQTELAVSRLAKDAEARCAEWLLQHAQRSKDESLAVTLDQRKRLIAAQLGIAPETLSRVLRNLRERSLISGTGRSLQLIDPSGLRQLAG
jgi:CRP-like cAMP-binding protein